VQLYLSVKGQAAVASWLFPTDQSKRSTDEPHTATREERYQIYILKKAEYSQAQIAELLERDKTTISRELRQSLASFNEAASKYNGKLVFR